MPIIYSCHQYNQYSLLTKQTQHKGTVPKLILLFSPKFCNIALAAWVSPIAYHILSFSCWLKWLLTPNSLIVLPIIPVLWKTFCENFKMMQFCCLNKRGARKKQRDAPPRFLSEGESSVKWIKGKGNRRILYNIVSPAFVETFSSIWIRIWWK